MNAGSWEDRRRGARHRLGSIFKAAKIEPVYTFRTAIPRDFDPEGRCYYNFVEHCRPLEKAFPGCSVTWDHHPELRTWERYGLVIAHNRVSHLPIKNREARHEARLPGHFLLLAFHLTPDGRGRWLPHRIALQYTDRTFAGFAPQITQDRLIYATYSTRDERWTVIR